VRSPWGAAWTMGLGADTSQTGVGVLVRMPSGLSVVALFVPGALGATPSIRPPGDCTPERHAKLQMDVSRECRSKGMRCEARQSCAQLLDNLGQFYRCIDARVSIMDECFRGGDQAHKDEVARYRVGADRCRQLMAQKNCAEELCE
jgi:hypothetical protein